MLLGLQTLRNMGTKIDCVNQAIHFEAFDLSEPFSSPAYLRLRISEEREIPPETRVWVPTKIVNDPLIKEIGHQKPWATESGGGGGGGGCSPQFLPHLCKISLFFSQILAFLCLQPPHISVKFTPPSMGTM